MKRKVHSRKHVLLRAAAALRAGAAYASKRGDKQAAKAARASARFILDLYAKGQREPTIELKDSPSPHYRK